MFTPYKSQQVTVSPNVIKKPFNEDSEQWSLFVEDTGLCGWAAAGFGVLVWGGDGGKTWGSTDSLTE